jgi:hypothetical protein
VGAVGVTQLSKAKKKDKKLNKSQQRAMDFNTRSENGKANPKGGQS